MSKDIQKQFEIKSHHFRCIKRLNIHYFKGQFKMIVKADSDTKQDNELIKNAKKYKIYCE